MINRLLIAGIVFIHVGCSSDGKKDFGPGATIDANEWLSSQRCASADEMRRSLAELEIGMGARWEQVDPSVRASIYATVGSMYVSEHRYAPAAQYFLRGVETVPAEEDVGWTMLTAAMAGDVYTLRRAQRLAPQRGWEEFSEWLTLLMKKGQPAKGPSEIEQSGGGLGGAFAAVAAWRVYARHCAYLAAWRYARSVMYAPPFRNPPMMVHFGLDAAELAHHVGEDAEAGRLLQRGLDEIRCSGWRYLETYRPKIARLEARIAAEPASRQCAGHDGHAR